MPAEIHGLIVDPNATYLSAELRFEFVALAHHLGWGDDLCVSGRLRPGAIDRLGTWLPEIAQLARAARMGVLDRYGIEDRSLTPVAGFSPTPTSTH